MLQELESALNTLDNLKQYLSLIDKTNDLTKYNPVVTDSTHLIVMSREVRSLLKGFSRKRVFEYNSIIISVYGVLENYIEDSITSYVNWLNRIIPSYEKLPQAIIDNHYELSAKLINNLQKPKYSKLTTKEEVITNLHSCIVNTSYKLNHYAYIDHTANFRHSEVITILGQVGIADLTLKIFRCPIFNSYLATLHQTENVVALGELAFQPLKDLALRRNDVAHGGDDDILGHSLLLELITYVKKYIESLYYVMRQELLNIALSASTLRVDTIHRVFLNGTVACFTLSTGTLSVKDPLIYTASDSSSEYKLSCIADIHVDKNPHPTITCTAPTVVCLSLPTGSKINKNSIIHFISPQLDALLAQI